MSKANGSDGQAPKPISVHGYDRVAFDPRESRGEVGKKALLVQVDNEKSCGKTMISDLVLSEIERRVMNKIPTVMFHLHEVESAQRLGGKYLGMFSTGFDKIVVEAGFDARDLPMPNLRSHLQSRVPVFLDMGANTHTTLNGIFEFMVRNEIAKFVRVRIVIVPANRDAITSAINILGPLTNKDDLRRIIVVENYNETDMVLVDNNLRQQLAGHVKRVMDAGGMVVRMPWCVEVPKDGFADAFGELAGPNFKSILGIEEAMRRIAEEEDTLTSEENDDLTRQAIAARKIHNWAIDVMAKVGAPIVNRLEEFHKELGGVLFEPTKARRQFIPGGSTEDASKAA